LFGGGTAVLGEGSAAKQPDQADGAIRFAIAPYAVAGRGNLHCQELFFGQSAKLWATPVKFSPPGYAKFSSKTP
jgi:hypothetical protein